MSKVKHAEYTSDIEFILDYLVPREEYEAFKTRVKNQLLKNVEVAGFRKGKVPPEIALKYVDQHKLTQTILQETLERYAPDVVDNATDQLRKDKRIALNLEVSIDPTYTGESSDGFKIRLVARLLPTVDLSSIDTLRIDYPNSDEIPNRPDQETFIKQEFERFIRTYNEYDMIDDGAKTGDVVICDLLGTIDNKPHPLLSSSDTTIALGSGDFLPEFEKELPGVKPGEIRVVKVTFPSTYFESTIAGKSAVFTVQVKSVQRPKYTTVDDVLKHNAAAREQFTSREQFTDFLKKFYVDETDRLLEEMWQKRVIQEVVRSVPDFALQEDRVEAETGRIFALLKDDAASKNISLLDAFLRAGIPADTIPKNDELAIRTAVEDYVRREFKLSSILHSVYERLVETKISQRTLEQAMNEVARNPQQFGITDTKNQQYIRDFALDRLKRQEGAQYLFTKLKSVNSITDATLTGTKS